MTERPKSQGYWQPAVIQAQHSSLWDENCRLTALVKQLERENDVLRDLLTEAHQCEKNRT